MTTINHIEYNAILTAHKIFALYADRNKTLKSYLKTNSNWREVIKLVLSMAREDIQNGGHELARTFIRDIYFSNINHKIAYQLAVETYS